MSHVKTQPLIDEITKRGGHVTADAEDHVYEALNEAYQDGADSMRALLTRALAFIDKTQCGCHAEDCSFPSKCTCSTYAENAERAALVEEIRKAVK